MKRRKIWKVRSLSCATNCQHLLLNCKTNVLTSQISTRFLRRKCNVLMLPRNVMLQPKNVSRKNRSNRWLWRSQMPLLQMSSKSLRTWWLRLRRIFAPRRKNSSRSPKNFSNCVLSRLILSVTSQVPCRPLVICKLTFQSLQLRSNASKSSSITLTSKFSIWRERLPVPRVNAPKRRRPS